MILQSLLSDEGTKSNGTYSNLEKYYIFQGSKRVNSSILKEEIAKATNGLDKIAQYKIVGGLRRKNIFVENITILVKGNKSTLEQIATKYGITDVENNKCSKIISINNKIITENYIVVNPKYFGINLIKYTGSHIFTKMMEERASSLGMDFNCIKAETEKEVFEILRVPYIEPSCRECEYDVRIPINEILLRDIPTFDISPHIITFKDFVINGKRYVEKQREEKKIGIQLECLSQFDKTQMDCFDFIFGGYYLSSQTSLSFAKIISKINKPLIINNFGTNLSIPLRIISARVNWAKEFKNLIDKNVVIYINGDENNLHPTLLNLYQKMGGKFIVENCERAFELSRKALLAKSNIIHNNFRFNKIGEF